MSKREPALPSGEEGMPGIGIARKPLGAARRACCITACAHHGEAPCAVRTRGRAMGVSFTNHSLFKSLTVDRRLRNGRSGSDLGEGVLAEEGTKRRVADERHSEAYHLLGSVDEEKASGAAAVTDCLFVQT